MRVFWILLLLVSFGFFCARFSRKDVKNYFNDGAVTTGRVTGVEAATRSIGHGTYAAQAVRYRYSVGGRDYEGTEDFKPGERVAAGQELDIVYLKSSPRTSNALDKVPYVRGTVGVSPSTIKLDPETEQKMEESVRKEREFEELQRKLADTTKRR